MRVLGRHCDSSISSSQHSQIKMTSSRKKYNSAVGPNDGYFYESEKKKKEKKRKEKEEDEFIEFDQKVAELQKVFWPKFVVAKGIWRPY